ncbi:PTS system IIA component, Gat family [Anaerovirgula multivorans]|uniref:PTS system IIA component, Gat family n=1 Tax=Anaerovirgula multivorans TaxID=312168 RepID=A0A239CZI6_9FIRM|nr:PTS sugar transporter subunit IIA [Anaerovirgula multivorans]SNS25635.1 PTS system IIA component, Gat family [Anaerovirgula multivorans]
MNGMKEKVYHDVLILNDLTTKEEVIEKMSDYLLDKGYINEKYCKATLERENIFPTGLSTKPVGTAIPHSDAENVVKPAVLLAILNNTVEFSDMGNKENKISVGIVFLMALKGENNQINYLRNIVEFCKHEENIMGIYGIKDTEKIMEIFLQKILV